jgi:hypothetical protein
MSPEQLASTFVRVLINPMLALLFAAGLLVFIFGLIEYLYALNVKGEQPDKGKKHMFWGLVGMFIMVASWAILQVIANTICPGGLGGCYR